MAFQALFDVGIAHTGGHNRFLRGFTFGGVEPEGREIPADFHIARFHFTVVDIGQPRENHPPAGIPFKAFIRLRRKAVRGFHGSIGMADPGGRPEQHRRAVFLGIRKGLLDHLIRFFRRRRIEYRDTAEIRIPAGILLCLGGDGARIIRAHNHQPALHADISHRHQRIGSNVQAHLFHCDHRPCAAVGGRRGYFQRSFFINGPFKMQALVRIVGNRLYDLGRRRTGIPRHKIHPCGQRAQRNCAVSHNVLFHLLTSEMINGSLFLPFSYLTIRHRTGQ